MATKLKVVYLDGRTVEVIASPRAQVMTEQYLGGITDRNMLQAAFYLAWASLHKAGKEANGFEAWLDLIADAEEIDDEKVDPTGPAPEADTSSS